jgi:hypothetical protein
LFELPSNKNPLQNQYLPHLSSENCEINSIRSGLGKGFPTTPRTPPNFSIKLSILILILI